MGVVTTAIVGFLVLSLGFLGTLSSEMATTVLATAETPTPSPMDETPVPTATTRAEPTPIDETQVPTATATDVIADETATPVVVSQATAEVPSPTPNIIVVTSVPEPEETPALPPGGSCTAPSGRGDRPIELGFLLLLGIPLLKKLSAGL